MRVSVSTSAHVRLHTRRLYKIYGVHTYWRIAARLSMGAIAAYVCTGTLHTCVFSRRDEVMVIIDIAGLLLAWLTAMLPLLVPPRPARDHDQGLYSRIHPFLRPRYVVIMIAGGGGRLIAWPPAAGALPGRTLV